MQGNRTIVNQLLLQFQASNVAGFYNKVSFVDSPLFMKYPDEGAEKYRLLSLMQHFQIQTKGSHLSFPLTEKDEREYNALLLPVRPKSYVIIHPCSCSATRQWPTKYFAAIGDFCIEKDFTVIITGTKEESDITSEVIKSMHHVPIDLAGQTSPGALGVLVKNALMLVSNCTGISHISDALDTPSVIVSMDGEPERWSPENKELHRVIDWTKEPDFKKVFTEAKNLLQNLI